MTGPYSVRPWWSRYLAPLGPDPARRLDALNNRADRIVAAETDVRVAQARGRAFEAVIGIAVANYRAPRCDGHSVLPRC
jgi:hypothetical protein